MSGRGYPLPLSEAMAQLDERGRQPWHPSSKWKRDGEEKDLAATVDTLIGGQTFDGGSGEGGQ